PGSLAHSPRDWRNRRATRTTEIPARQESPHASGHPVLGGGSGAALVADVGWKRVALETQLQTVDLPRISRELDLESRLRQIPATARTRGIHFHSLREASRRRGLLGIPELDRILDAPRRSYALYPVSELVEATAIAGALAAVDPREGMRELWKDNP